MKTADQTTLQLVWDKTVANNLAVHLSLILLSVLVYSPSVGTVYSLQPNVANCTNTSVGLAPLTDLGTGFYKGNQGGLYPGGSNFRPPAHETAGMELARTIKPLNSRGEPDPEGRYVLLSIGMSNTAQEFSVFKPLADLYPDKDPHLVIVNGAQGGWTAARIIDPNAAFWTTVDRRLADAGVTPHQVVVAWMKEANANPSQAFPQDAKKLQEELTTIAQILETRFPNIKVAYLSSRIYAGYASTRLNPEPFAYQSGFAVKWLVEAQINGAPELNYDPGIGKVMSPWLSWGPYLWADGLLPRSDGLIWACDDLTDDGTHPSPSGQKKVAQLLLDFFKTDSTTRSWFLKPEISTSTQATAAIAVHTSSPTTTASVIGVPATAGGLGSTLILGLLIGGIVTLVGAVYITKRRRS